MRFRPFSESPNPVKVVGHDVTCNVKAEPDFVNVSKLFQNKNKHFGMQYAVEVSPTRTIQGRHCQATASI